jgi:hypothetical protein
VQLGDLVAVVLSERHAKIRRDGYYRRRAT